MWNGLGDTPGAKCGTSLEQHWNTLNKFQGYLSAVFGWARGGQAGGAAGRRSVRKKVRLGLKTKAPKMPEKPKNVSRYRHSVHKTDAVLSTPQLICGYPYFMSPSFLL